MRPVEPSARERAYGRENRETIPTLSSTLRTERNARLAALFGSFARIHVRTDPDVDVPTFPAYDIAGLHSLWRWHISYAQRHVEMRGELELLLATIHRPDLQEPDPRPGRERYWLRTQPPFRFRWLRAVVHNGSN